MKIIDGSKKADHYLILFAVFCTGLIAIKQTLTVWFITNQTNLYINSLAFQFIWTFLLLFIVWAIVPARPFYYFTISLLYYFFSVIEIGYWVYTQKPIPLSFLLTSWHEATQALAVAKPQLTWQVLIPFADLPFLLVAYKIKAAPITWPMGKQKCIAITSLLLIFVWIIGYSRGLGPLNKELSDQRAIRANGLLGWWFSSITKQVIYGQTPARRSTPMFEDLTVRKRLKVISIQWESLDANIVNYTCGNQIVTPNLSKLLTNGLFFSKIHAQHSCGGSSDADAAILWGVNANDQWPVFQNGAIPKDWSLPTAIGSNQSVAYHNNSGNFFSRSERYSANGITSFMDNSSLGLETIHWGSPDHLFFPSISNDWNHRGCIPDLSIIITLSSHHPFTLPRRYGVKLPPFDSASSDSDRAYFQAIWYTDEAIGPFINSIDLSNNWVLIFGDHSPGIPQDRNSSSYYPNNSFRDSSSISEGLLNEYVPFLILGPASEIESLKNQRVNIIDQTDIHWLIRALLRN